MLLILPAWRQLKTQYLGEHYVYQTPDYRQQHKYDPDYNFDLNPA